jgi:hypothetical protein
MMIFAIPIFRRTVASRIHVASVVGVFFLAVTAGGGAVIAAPDQPAAEPTQEATASAFAYAQGNGVTRSPRKAAVLYCEAARAGDVDSVFTLGWMYANGIGVARDVAAAAALFARASALGHVHAGEILTVLGEERQELPPCMVASDWTAAKAIAQIDAETVAKFDLKPDVLLEALMALPVNRRSVADLIIRVAPTYQIDPRLALAVVAVESNFQPLARSVKDARGLMQLSPETAARFNVQDTWNVQQNVRGGLAYLRWLLAYYEGRVSLAVAAYNAGEAAVDKHGGIPPFAETREYVKRIKRLFDSEQHPYDARIAKASPIVAKLSAAP